MEILIEIYLERIGTLGVIVAAKSSLIIYNFGRICYRPIHHHNQTTWCGILAHEVFCLTTHPKQSLYNRKLAQFPPPQKKNKRKNINLINSITLELLFCEQSNIFFDKTWYKNSKLEVLTKKQSLIEFQRQYH